MPENNKISAVIITLNSAGTLAPTLEALRWCDEIIVVDSGSTDETREICLQHSCKFVVHSFEGYGAQKQYATGLASNDWILSIDSDEVVSDALKKEIECIFASENISYSGFMIPISLVFMGKVFRYGKESRLAHLRLYNRNFGGFNDTKLHEKVILQGKVKTLKNNVLHNSYRDLAHYFQKFNSFTSYAMLDAIKKGKKVTKLEILLKIPVTFLVIYFLQLNFLNGFPGLVWSTNSAFYSFVKYLKIYEKTNILSI